MAMTGNCIAKVMRLDDYGQVVDLLGCQLVS